jgi:proteasome lid subunit RPN8/RPN11
MRIVGEERRPIRVVARPQNFEPHPWAQGAPPKPDLFLTADLAKEVAATAAQSARAGRESLGLLLGDAFRDGDGAPFAVAGALVTSSVDATRTHVRFTAARFAELARAIERVAFEHVIVGWFHTHLGLGCAPSPTDLATQRRYFSAEHQVTWVVDPELRESQGYVLRSGAARPVGIGLLRAPAGQLGTYLTPRRGTLPGTRPADTSR